LRKRILAAVRKNELTQAEILRIFNLSRTGLNSFLKHFYETGSIEPKPFGGGRRSKFEEDDIEIIKQYMINHPDATLEEILEYSGKEASIMSVHRMLKKIGYRLKKSHYSPASKNEKTLKGKGNDGSKK
jgi:transposase